MEDRVRARAGSERPVDDWATSEARDLADATRRRLRRDIDETRASISRTVGDLRQRADAAMQWQTYVKDHPGRVLIGAIAGRRLARRMSAPGEASGSDWEAEAGLTTSARVRPARDESLSAATASWQRLAARVETLVNGVIDEVADATEQALVPALVGGVRAFLESRPERPLDRPLARERAPRTPAREGSFV